MPRSAISKFCGKMKKLKIKSNSNPRKVVPSGKYKPTRKDQSVVTLMDGGITQSRQVLAAVSESMGETSEDPGSSNGNGDKRCGRQAFWRPVKSAYQAPEVQI